MGFCEGDAFSQRSNRALDAGRPFYWGRVQHPKTHNKARRRGHRALIMVWWAELLTLAPGARVPVGLPDGSGAPGAVQWTATASHARETSDPLRVLEQGPDRQRTPGACSGGVSSMLWSLPVSMNSQSVGQPSGAIGLYACLSQLRVDARRAQLPELPSWPGCLLSAGTRAPGGHPSARGWG